MPLTPIEPSQAEGTPTLHCVACGQALDLRSSRVFVHGRTVRVFCSAACARPLAPQPPSRRRRRLARVALGIPMLLLTSGRVPTTSAPIAQAATVAPAPPTLGPAWPPSDDDWARMLAADAWIHPLAGPTRRMPLRDSRIFGAERPGDRPAECASGHCGVDLSGPWGEPVHAAHAGVVDRVVRGPNDEHGGLYVRLAHRDGSVFTQYFHLAAIPKRLEPGVVVRRGEIIGLLGDSGVVRSGPHLHFAMSVRSSSTLPERYIDPEPLIALWPLPLGVAVAPDGIDLAAAPALPRRIQRRTAPSAVDSTAPSAVD
jgi:hypothetical protein